MLKRVSVFCGSKEGTRGAYAAAAQAMGRALASKRVGLVYGGGGVGMMGRLAEATRAAGGEVTGVIPRALLARESVPSELADLRIVGSMHERKAIMAEISDGFIALPGGFGTFEEFWEMLTWAQLGLHNKPIGLLNVESYFDPLIELVDHAVTEGFADDDHRALVVSDCDPERLLHLMETSIRPVVEKWIDPDET
jgi:uncharacterized protein (TIGR00730 family)